VGTRVRSFENGRKFFKKVGIFPEMGVSPRKGLHFFYTGLLTQYFFELTPRCMPSGPSNQPLIKKKRYFIGVILGLGLFVLFHLYPLSHEKATVALYVGRIRIRLGVVHFRIFRLFLTSYH